CCIGASCQPSRESSVKHGRKSLPPRVACTKSSVRSVGEATHAAIRPIYPPPRSAQPRMDARAPAEPADPAAGIAHEIGAQVRGVADGHQRGIGAEEGQPRHPPCRYELVERLLQRGPLELRGGEATTGRRHLDDLRAAGDAGYTEFEAV